jgi:hypothetical protein
MGMPGFAGVTDIEDRGAEYTVRMVVPLEPELE